MVSPWYVAKIECVPTPRLEPGKVALPAERGTAGGGALSTVKTTSPIGGPDPGSTAATVAVTVAWPTTDGLADEASALVAEPCPPVCPTASAIAADVTA